MLTQPLPPRQPVRQVAARLLRRSTMIAAAPALLLLAVMVPMWINDAHLAAMTDRLLAHPLPPQTEFAVYGAQSSVGLQVGNSNHCDFLVTLELLTHLSKEEITSYYEKAGGLVFVQDGDPRAVVVRFMEMRDAGWDLRCH